MAKKIFDFEAEFKLGIDAVDSEHVQLVDMLNHVHTLIGEGRKDEAQLYFCQTLSNYVNEHFANEEKFMESIEFPQLDEHKKVHENFKRTIENIVPLIASYNDEAFRKALTDTYTWILTHIGKTDRKYARFYLAKVN